MEKNHKAEDEKERQNIAGERPNRCEHGHLNSWFT
jgi:hypothetical protein